MLFGITRYIPWRVILSENRCPSPIEVEDMLFGITRYIPWRVILSETVSTFGITRQQNYHELRDKTRSP